MAYSINGLSLVAQRVGASQGAVWMYVSADPFDTVSASDYFADAALAGVKDGDIVHVIDTTNDVATTGYFSNIDSDDNATITICGAVELTASGAISPDVQIVDLNHASVVIAATVADAAVYAGKVVVFTNTSASGTAAHTVTLTAGTFDGTNNVATLNAPAEKLAVLFGQDGNGTVIANTGSVALS